MIHSLQDNLIEWTIVNDLRTGQNLGMGDQFSENLFLGTDQVSTAVAMQPGGLKHRNISDTLTNFCICESYMRLGNVDIVFNTRRAQTLFLFHEKKKKNAKYFMLVNSTNKKRIQEVTDWSKLYLSRECYQKEHK